MRALVLKPRSFLCVLSANWTGDPPWAHPFLNLSLSFGFGDKQLRADLHGRHISLIRSFAEGPNADAKTPSSILDGLEGFAHTGSCLVYKPELGSDLDRKSGILCICTSIV